MSSKRISMSPERAKRIVMIKFPKLNVISAVDFDDYYVFNTTVGNTDTPNSLTQPIRNPIAVQKSTGKIIAFNPLEYDVDEYSKAVDQSTIVF